MGGWEPHHVQNPLETCRKARLQPGGGCVHLQSKHLIYYIYVATTTITTTTNIISVVVAVW